MATLAKTARTLDYTVVANTAGPFSLGFRVFDTDGFEVWVNDVLIDPADYTINATFSGGYTDAASITFDTALEIDDELIVHGAMVADREGDLGAGASNLVADMNIELPRLAAMASEAQRDLGRSIKTIKTPVKPFEPVDQRVLYWDALAGAFASGPTVPDIDAIPGLSQAAVDAKEAAEAARDKAEQWAEEDEDVEVESGQYSAKHHALKSSESAGNSATSETNAALSAVAAENARDQAQLAALAAGANIVTSLTSPTPADDTVELLQTGPGLALYQVVSSSWELQGWIGEVLYDDVAAVLAGTETMLSEGQIIRTRSEGFSYEAAASGATDHHLTTAGGVKLYCLRAADGSFNVMQFGAKGDNVADDLLAFETACSAHVRQDGSQSFVGRVYAPVPEVGYKFSAALNLKHTVELIGLGGGIDNPRAVLMLFPADTNGIIVNSSPELDEALDPAGQTTGAFACILKGLAIDSAGGTEYKHGIRLRTRCIIENCRVTDFPGHGIAVIANSGFGDEYLRGNANNFKIQNCRVTGNHMDGLYVDGGDANSGLVMGLDCSNNGRYGFFDESFLGNTYVGCHTNSNGTRPDITNITQANPAVITFSAAHPFTDGDRTFIENVVGMTEINNQTAIVTVIDSTSISVPINSTGYTAYTSGGRAFWGGAMRLEQANQRCVVIGQYHEPGQGYTYASGSNYVIGGHTAGQMLGDGTFLDDGAQINGKFLSQDGNIESRMADNLAAMTFQNNDVGDVYRVTPDGGDWKLTKNNSGDIMRLTGSGTTYTLEDQIAFRRFLLNNRRMDSETAVPSSGSYTRGDIIFNRNVSAGGSPGWACTTTGTAGSTAVFKALPNVAA